MLDRERQRIDKIPSKEDSELRDFAEKIIRGDENRSRQWLRREERWRRRVEIHGDWLKTKDEEEVSGDNVRVTKEEL